MRQILNWCIVALSPGLLILAGVAVLVGVMSLWAKRQKKQLRHSPLTKDLLRSPGQSLREKLLLLDFDVLSYLVMLMLAPFVIYSLHISGSYFLSEPETFARAAFSCSILIVGCTLVARKLWVSLEERKIAILGLEGELATGEELNQLMLDGCRVFHDIPIRWGNIDHVVVSQSGVYSVNTKLLGKPKQGDGKAEIIVDHDQNVIRFPDRPVRIPNDKLEMEAKWLAQHLTSSVGQKVEVEPMLALPGWFIKERKGRGSVYVFNPIKPKKFFVQKRQVLSPEMVQQIAHQLEQLCRTVEPSFREKQDWSK